MPQEAAQAEDDQVPTVPVQDRGAHPGSSARRRRLVSHFLVGSASTRPKRATAMRGLARLAWTSTGEGMPRRGPRRPRLDAYNSGGQAMLCTFLLAWVMVDGHRADRHTAQ